MRILRFVPVLMTRWRARGGLEGDHAARRPVAGYFSSRPDGATCTRLAPLAGDNAFGVTRATMAVEATRQRPCWWPPR